MLERAKAFSDLPRGELLYEAAAVLAGTILMGSGTSGGSPQAHDSSTTLGTLLPRIAAYRDAFYQHLFQRLKGSHAARLKSEASRLHQPFAAARQHLNSQLSRRRALQLQHVNLALLFARLGFPEAASKQVRIVPAVSARMICQIHCLMTATHRAADQGKPAAGAEHLAEIEGLLHRAIECGAIVDPWNILGFGGQFSLFPAMENSIPDARVDELLEMMERLFNAFARVWHQSATDDNKGVLESLPADFERLAEWWDTFATGAVAGSRWVSGREGFAAAGRVAEALSAWHRAGAAGGDLSFWRPYADEFDSPQAYAWVIGALLEKRDLSAAMALLMHWLSQAEIVPLEEGAHSFHTLGHRWMRMALDDCRQSAADGPRRLVRKFFDFLEANADNYWQVPELETVDLPRRSEAEGKLAGSDPDAESEDDEDDLYGAAYDEMVYRDSTDDNVEGSMLESLGPASDDERAAESSQLVRRLSFLVTLARLWRQVALFQVGMAAENPPLVDCWAAWRERAETNSRALRILAADVASQPVARPTASQESMLEYDRRWNIKESLLERIVTACVAVDESRQFLDAAAAEPDRRAAQEPADRLWQAVLTADATAAQACFPAFLVAVKREPLLYLRLSKGGEPEKIASVRGLQQMFRHLLRRLPRLGLLRETCQLIQAARAMERDHAMGPGAVTEFDRLFEVGFKAVVESVVESSATWAPEVAAEPSSSQQEDDPSDDDPDGDPRDDDLIDALQQVTESLLDQWSSHSQTLRLSVLEKVSSEKDWQELVRFVERYGQDLFTQSFFHYANLRAILHQGVDAWLEQLIADPEQYADLQLVADLDRRLPRAQAKKHLTTVIEAVVENFGEYRDYNATTTQSDRGGQLFTLLDFLRLKTVYERIHWNLRPVMMVHEVLVRQERGGAARLWARAMAKETQSTADGQLQRLAGLQKNMG